MTGPLIPFHRPSIGDRERASVDAVLRHGWLTSGPVVQRFETMLERQTGAKRVLALSSGTAALHLGLVLSDVGPGDAVLVPVMTFTATAEAVLYVGARPVFADVDPATLNLSVESAERSLVAEVRAIIPVDLGGIPHDQPGISKLAEQHRATVVVDAAHSLGSCRGAVPVGADEGMAALSFYATKPITTGEGGALVLNRPELVERAELLRLHGLSHGAAERYAPGGKWRYDVIDCGFKYNLPDLSAAVGVSQLERLDEMQRRRSAIASVYLKELRHEALELPAVPVGMTTNWHLFVVRLNLDRLRIGRDEFMAELGDLGVGTSVHFIPLHLHSFYRRRYGLSPDQFPVATSESERILSLPIYPDLSDDEVGQVISAVRAVAERHRR